MDVQLVHILAGCRWSVIVLLGLLHPIWLAQRWRAGSVPPLSDYSQLEFRSPTKIVWLTGLRWCLCVSRMIRSWM